MSTPQLVTWTLSRAPLVADPNLRTSTGRTTRIIARAASAAAVNPARNLLVLVATEADETRYTEDLIAAGVEGERIAVRVTEPTGDDWSIGPLVTEVSATTSLVVVDHYVWEQMADAARYDDHEALRAAVEG